MKTRILKGVTIDVVKTCAFQRSFSAGASSTLFGRLAIEMSIEGAYFHLL